MQITITISKEEYDALKKSAEIHLNSMSKEARVIIRQSLFNTVLPGYIPTPIPHGAPGGIPAEPYKITPQTDTTPVQPTKTKNEMLREKHPDWFTSDGKPKVIGAVDEEIEKLFTEDRGRHSSRINYT